MEAGIIISTLSILWLVIAGTFYAARVALVRVDDSKVWRRVVIGVTYTCIGGIGLQIGILVTPGLPANIREVMLVAAPWVSFIITGAPMILGQILKHKILAWAQLTTQKTLDIRRQLDEGDEPDNRATFIREQNGV